MTEKEAAYRLNGDYDSEISEYGQYRTSDIENCRYDERRNNKTII
jgi:hypothetical protein